MKLDKGNHDALTEPSGKVLDLSNSVKIHCDEASQDHIYQLEKYNEEDIFGRKDKKGRYTR